MLKLRSGLLETRVVHRPRLQIIIDGDIPRRKPVGDPTEIERPDGFCWRDGSGWFFFDFFFLVQATATNWTRSVLLKPLAEAGTVETMTTCEPPSGAKKIVKNHVRTQTEEPEGIPADKTFTLGLYLGVFAFHIGNNAMISQVFGSLLLKLV